MNRENYLASASRLLSRLVYEVKVKNAADLFDINKVAEDFYIPILHKILDAPKLKNQNRIVANFPSVDLGCDASRISIQVTSDPSSAKVVKTLDLFRAHNLQSEFDELYILVITEKQNTYSSRKLDEATQRLPISFDPKKHIIDYRDLVSKLGDKSTETIEAVSLILEREFADHDRRVEFHADLENFLQVNQSKIEFEKRSKKYIPSIFIETTSVKDQVRFFSNPIFFYRKLDDIIDDIDLTRLNDLLRMARQKPIAEDFVLPHVRGKVSSLQELRAELKDRAETLRALLAQVLPLSMDRGGVERFEPDVDVETYRRIWSFPIESHAYGVKRRIENGLEVIRLTEARIFLITGMAGQGKTNFVCDLIENQFRKFRLPSLFIPARELNRYVGHDQIFKFIMDNRYAPEVRDLHALLKLFDAIASELGKPFTIVIDGINEVGHGFETNLNAFLESVSQYEFIKVLITCRIEFFERRFSSMMTQTFSEGIFRVENLRSKMTERQKERLIEGYFRHFRVGLTVSDTASDFLKNDLLLLRIFCEIEEGAPPRFVSTIFKGELFEQFLLLKVSTFEEGLRRHVVPALYAIAERMLASGDFTKLDTSGMQDRDLAVIDRLIDEDVILRSEPAEATLASAGHQSVSFTYDELRDFVISYYVVNELAGRAFVEVEAVFSGLDKFQIGEGVFRYTYLLARKHARAELIGLCEAQPNFTTHYVNNVDLIPPDQQVETDVERLKTILTSSNVADHIRTITVFLYRRRDLAQPLNISILVDHVNTLDDTGCREFFRVIFSTPYDWREDWSAKLTQIIMAFLERVEMGEPQRCPPLLAFMLQLAGFSDWGHREAIFNRIGSLVDNQDLSTELAKLQGSRSGVIRRVAQEVGSAEGQAGA